MTRIDIRNCLNEESKLPAAVVQLRTTHELILGCKGGIELEIAAHEVIGAFMSA
jgi:hypothetical protein